MTAEERLEGLEKQLTAQWRIVRRFNSRLLAVLCLCVGAWILAGVFGLRAFRGKVSGPALKQVRAKSFVLEEESGEARALLVMLDGAPVLAFNDDKGESRAFLGLDKDGPMLSFADANGNTRAMLAVTKEGWGLGLSDENGDNRAIVRVAEDGPGLLLFGPHNKVLWQAP